MVNVLIGGITLLAIFLAFINMGTPLGAASSIVSTVGLLVGVRNLRIRQRSTHTAPTKITR